MSGNTLNRIFLARLAGTAVFDPNGDPVGKVRDAVATLRTNNAQPRILGLVVEVPMRRRVFVPITRVTSIESGTVIITGLVNMRRFEVRTGEVLVLGDMLDRSITLVESDENVMDEAERNANGLHFQKLLLENLYDYFSTARKWRPNRTKADIDAGITMNFVNNRTLGRFFCFATEWQLPTEGMEDLFSMIDSITQEDLNGQLIPKHKWSAIRLRFDEIMKLFNTTRRRFILRPEVFGLDRHGNPFGFQGVMSDI